ncbi:SDR family NAD(P)-dependent oxidoreductase [Sulfurimonas sp. HSL-3221]|uniref:SDR family NAD(P)-dependent oxidoreductase n=1 Tax=Sulfurimonadaceae TaxID=2771471 RepID=UPI001E4089EC|nr:SDR family NAD(P)-dependent oxidoreductase [Sulfurimonas sp. HSL-3221]UFS63630.1 SDR family NAD(P)-dependent oxidoreductase [Sulfurimonas sp. HSL-3221]
MKKSILITGCSSGIGYETALTLFRQGYDVFATARAQEDVLRLISEGLNAHQLDVTDPDSIDAALKWVLEQTGGTLYALFNNAGYGQPGALEDVPTFALREQFETNVLGLHELTRRVLPLMLAQGYGRILQHSSVLGLVSLRFRGAYNASKYAIEGLCDTLRLELEGTGVHVVTLNTGPIRSRFRDNAIKMFEKNVDTAQSRFADVYQEEVYKRKANKEEKDRFTRDADAVTRKVIRALEAERPAPRYHITGATTLLALFKRLLPTRGLDALLRKIQ